jgi:GIY-YIG catalytic domain
MMIDFAGLVSRMDPMLAQLRNAEVFCVSDCGKFPSEPGVYLLSESHNDLYVGRTSSLKNRMRGHGSKSHYSASFALKLAREKAEKPATYRTDHSAKTLMSDDHFRAIFHGMIARVKKMQVRYVVEANDHAQYLFEMYASLVLQVPYCDFANH